MVRTMVATQPDEIIWTLATAVVSSRCASSERFCVTPSSSVCLQPATAGARSASARRIAWARRWTMNA
jgi:hypothetical protein